MQAPERPSTLNGDLTVRRDSADDLIREQRQRINESNQREFIEPKAIDDPEICARTSVRLIDRSVQMRQSVVDNRDGPLLRSIHGSNNGGRRHFCAAEERMRNLEGHLAMDIAPIDKSIFERMKIIEDKIMKIEEHFPQVAARCFAYGPPSEKPGRRKKTEYKYVDEPSTSKRLRLEEGDFAVLTASSPAPSNSSAKDYNDKMENASEKLSPLQKGPSSKTNSSKKNSNK